MVNMFNNFAFQLIILMMVKEFNCITGNDVTVKYLKQPLDKGCRSYQTAYNKFSMNCSDGVYDIELLNMPNKNFTNILFCPPALKFSYNFWDNLNNQDGKYNVTVCTISQFSPSENIKVPCKQIYLTGIINCNYSFIENENAVGEIKQAPSATVKTTTKLSELFVIQSKAHESPILTSTASGPDNEAQHDENEIIKWKLAAFGSFGLFIAVAFAWVLSDRMRYKRKYNRSKLYGQQQASNNCSRQNPYVVNNNDKLLHPGETTSATE